MPRCDVCGNEYRHAFQVTMHDETHTFDSFECAIQMLAPICQHCGCRVIGHGVEWNAQVFCCDSCARLSGASMEASRHSGTESQEPSRVASRSTS